jgi:hypothetical protein
MTFKGYSYDKSKDRFVCRFMINGKRTQIGSFKLELDAQECVEKYLNENNIMPPKKVKLTTTKTLKSCCEFYDSLLNPDSTKSNWKRSLIGLVANTKRGELDDTLLNNELGEKYEDVDMIPIITDFDKVVETVDSIKSKRNGNGIANDTKKHYYAAVVALFTNKRNNVVVEKELKTKYMDKVKELDGLSNDKRNQNEPQRANLLYPEFTWEVMREELEKYMTTQSFGKTKTGIERLRRACIVGMFVLLRPRRVEDYQLLQYFSKLPKEEDRKDKNILLIEKGKATIYIDSFKTRHRVKNNKTKELMPTYVKELPPKLTEFLNDYIKKAQLKDNAKRTRQEVKDNVNYYIFHIEKGEQTEKYKNSGFSKAISAAMKEIYGKTDLSVNTIRHAFQSWIAQHIEEFTDAQLKQIFVDVGDTPKNMPTALRYRIAQQGNKGMEVTEIQDMIHDEEYAKKVMQGGAEEEGSVGNAGDIAEIIEDEILSPSPSNEVPQTAESICKKIGELHTEIARLQYILVKL